MPVQIILEHFNWLCRKYKLNLLVLNDSLKMFAAIRFINDKKMSRLNGVRQDSYLNKGNL